MAHSEAVGRTKRESDSGMVAPSGHSPSELGLFMETLLTLGPVGATVRILGTNLTGTTSVTFNGTAATFTVNSTGTTISTTVPSGATNGTVQAVTPGGTLSSNVPFRVRH